MARSSQRPAPRRDHRRQHPRNGHRSSSRAELLQQTPERDTARNHASRHVSHRDARTSESETNTGNTLSEASLAQLDALNARHEWEEYDKVQYKVRDRPQEPLVRGDRPRAHRVEKSDRWRRRDGNDHNHYRDQQSRRVASGALLEKGWNDSYYHPPRRRDGATSRDEDEWSQRKRRRKRLWIACGVIGIILIIAVAVGVTVSRKDKAKSSSSTSNGSSTTSSSTPSNSNLASINESPIPASAQGTYLDPFTWYDTTDFNLTYTNVTVGGLSIIGLNSTWNDNVRASDDVPALNDSWQYGTVPIRGMNLGGWLSIEPFITPSLFSGFSADQNIIDEWTLCTVLGATKAASTLEEHYSSFVTEQTFADIQAAGFDHVRISYSYWAVTTYDGDPYVPNTSWRYLLRGIEWARKHGLRINLDLHGLPGSQNGWNHSGHQGVIGWLNGTDGQLNADRSLDIHRQLSTFFAQPRYKNVVTMYGLVNEPKMTAIETNSVLNWTENAIAIVQDSGMSISTIIVFGDGFLGLANWMGKLQGYSNLLLDAHQYVIFNTEQIVLDHSAKINFACDGWTQQTMQSMSTTTGYGTFLCGEWSQADTDCVLYLNDVGVGSRWEGTLNTGNATTSVLTPQCPTSNNPRCSCDSANADASTYSAEYKAWLLMFAEAQMHSFELGWGWFYWTWQTESAVQWSWQAGMAAGTLPTNARVRSFDCDGETNGTGNDGVPDFAAAGLSETY